MMVWTDLASILESVGVKHHGGKTAFAGLLDVTGYLTIVRENFYFAQSSALKKSLLE